MNLQAWKLSRIMSLGIDNFVKLGEGKALLGVKKVEFVPFVRLNWTIMLPKFFVLNIVHARRFKGLNPPSLRAPSTLWWSTF